MLRNTGFREDSSGEERRAEGMVEKIVGIVEQQKRGTIPILLTYDLQAALIMLEIACLLDLLAQDDRLF